MKATVLTAVFAALLINVVAALAWDHYTQRLIDLDRPHGSSELVAGR